MKKQITIFIFIITIITSLSFEAIGSISKAQKLYKSKTTDKNAKITYELLMSKYYFSAIPFAIKHLRKTTKISSHFERALQILIVKTGVESFMNLPVGLLSKFKSPSLNFVLGIKLFEQKDYKNVVKFLYTIPEDNRFGPETKMTLAGSLTLLGETQKAYTEYKKCYNISGTFKNRTKNNKIKRYYAIIKETCLIHVARLKFAEGNYKEAIDTYDKITKRSYKWPYILLEKAWANYLSDDFNRTLGLLVTYKYPLLKSYFMPESEILSALSYYRLCLWDDALTVIKQYYNVYRPKVKVLKKFLLQHRRSNNYFLVLTEKKIEQVEKSHPYIRNLVTQIKKTIKYNLDYNILFNAKREYKKLSKSKRSPLILKMLKNSKREIQNRRKALNWYIKKYMFDFINNINKLSYEMFKIQIDIMSKKRNLLYKNTQLVSNRSRGDLAHVSRNSDQHFWEFNGAFWADELGDYSFGLKSNCTEINKSKEEL